VRGLAGLGSVGIGLGAILLVATVAAVWKPAASGSVAPTTIASRGSVAPSDSTSPSPLATVLVPGGITGLSAEAAEAAARSHIHPDAVLVSAVAGQFDAVYVPLGPNGVMPPDPSPSSLVWVVTFTSSVVVCPPPYVVNGLTKVKPCESPRPGTVTVVLDYRSGAFIRSDGFAPAP
jgi:hypothetical protein